MIITMIEKNKLIKKEVRKKIFQILQLTENEKKGVKNACCLIFFPFPTLALSLITRGPCPSFHFVESNLFLFVTMNIIIPDILASTILGKLN